MSAQKNTYPPLGRYPPPVVSRQLALYLPVFHIILARDPLTTPSPLSTHVDHLYLSRVIHSYARFLR